MTEFLTREDDVVAELIRGNRMTTEEVRAWAALRMVDQLDRLDTRLRSLERTIGDAGRFRASRHN
jgi:hypothetical protein